MGQDVYRRPILATVGVTSNDYIASGVESASTAQTLGDQGGHANISGASVTFTLATATAGMMKTIICSSGATNVVQGNSTAVLFDSLLAMGATTLTMSTGDACLLVARSTVQWDVITYSTGMTST